MAPSHVRVGIVGASGYTGAELARLLAGHQGASITLATATGERVGQKLSDLFPGLRGVSDIVLEEPNLETIAERCDVAIIALGHGKALEIVPPLLERGVKVIDLGADYRLRSPELYEKWYKLPHTAQDALKEAVYGLPEWNREAIKGARLIANPGCYPTSAILALSPYIAAQVVDPKSIIVDSASGVSGAGRSSFGVGTHFPEIFGDFKAYNVASHRHGPEIQQGLEDATPGGAGNPVVTFTAHLLPIARGILSTCYASLRQELTAEAAHTILAERYANEPFVRVLPAGQFPQIAHVVGSNFCDIGVTVHAEANRLVVISAEDNLVKGASGQAVQNMNLMFGLPETMGLEVGPLFP